MSGSPRLEEVRGTGRRDEPPWRFYTDEAGHFGRRTCPGPRSDLPLAERDPKDTTSVIRGALSELNVELIPGGNSGGLSG